jgi:hypothetical protein
VRGGRSWTRLAVPALLAVWLVGLPLFYFQPGWGAPLNPLDGPNVSAGLPHRATIGQLLAGAAVLLAGYALGRPLVARLLGRPRTLGGVLAAFGLGLGLLSVIDLLLAAVGLLRPTLLTVLTVALAVPGVALLARDSRPRLPRAVPRPALLLAAALLLVALGFAAVGAVAPETEYDAIWYHLGFPAAWLRTGALTDFPCQYVTAYPFGTELLYANAIAIAGPIAAKVVNLGFGLLLVGATADLGRRLFSPRAGLAGAVVLATAPTVLWEAATANVDLAAAAYLVLAVDVAVAHATRQQRRTAIACGLLAGFAVATKLLAGLAVPGLLLLVLLGPHARRRGMRVADAAIVAVLSILPVVPYLVRAEVLTGNPVFPSFYGVFGADASRWNASTDAGLNRYLDAFGLGHGPLRLLTLPWDVTMHPAAFSGSFGLLLLLGVPLAIRWRPRRVPALVALIAGTYAALWFWPAGTLQARFLVPAMALLAPFAGAGIERAAEAAGQVWRPLAGGVVVAVGVVAVLLLPPFTQRQERDPGRYLVNVPRATPLAYALGGESRDAYLTRHLPTYGAERRLRELAAPGDRAVVIANSALDQVDTPVEHVPVFAVCLAGVYVDPRRAADALARQRIRFVLWERAQHDGMSEVVVGRPAFEQRNLRLVYQDAGALLFERLRR